MVDFVNAKGRLRRIWRRFDMLNSIPPGVNETRQNSVQMFGRLTPVKHETDNLCTQKQ